MIKSRRMICEGHEVRIGTGESFWWGKLMGRDHMEDPGVAGGIILRGIFRKWDVGAWTGLLWLRLRTRGGRL
jgi:hypothetical protein